MHIQLLKTIVPMLGGTYILKAVALKDTRSVSLYPYLYIIGHKSWNVLSILNKLTL